MKRQTASPRWLMSLPLHNQLPSPLERGSVATLPEENTNVRVYTFFLIFIKKKRKKKGERRKEKGKGKEGGKSRENLAGRFSYSKHSFILIRIFLLTDKHKTIFWSHILYSGFAVGYFFTWGRKHFRAVVFQLLSSILFYWIVPKLGKIGKWVVLLLAFPTIGELRFAGFPAFFFLKCKKNVGCLIDTFCRCDFFSPTFSIYVYINNRASGCFVIIVLFTQ